MSQLFMGWFPLCWFKNGDPVSKRKGLWFYSGSPFSTALRWMLEISRSPCYWVVRDSFVPYLKVFLHSSGLDAVFPDCNSFLCWAIKGLVCMRNHWHFSSSMLKEPGIYHLSLVFHSSPFNFLIIFKGSPVLKTSMCSLVLI